MERRQALLGWARQFGEVPEQALVPASSDASFRRYFRLTTPDGSRMLMDAPPDQEDCRPFVHLAERFRQAGVHVPEILAWDEAQGFMMLSDFGDRHYLEALHCANDRAGLAQRLMGEAFDTLLRIQAMPSTPVDSRYDRAILRREVDLFPEWHIQRQLALPWGEEAQGLWEATLRPLFEVIEKQAYVWVHRDYHSRNLMVTEPNPGVLDFQDALVGPVSYDAVSLLKDAYIEWDEAQVIDWLVRYWEKARRAGIPVPQDFGVFYRDFEWMGVQRHLKVVGIFSRLALRDGKTGYLADIPRVAGYLIKTCRRYRELQPLALWLESCWSVKSHAGYTF